MMSRKGAAVFTGVVLCAMAVPMIGTFLGMRSGQAGNEETTSYPAIVQDRKFNVNILSDTGEWYDENHALRTQMIDADAHGLLLVGDSANEEVIVGKDGWEYYADEEGDLYGTSKMSERALFDLSRSMKMMQDALEKSGTAFVFAVAPNKSTMVPEYLPDYVAAAATAGGGSGNLDGLAGQMQEQGVHFLDLRQVLEKAAQDNGLSQAQMWLKTDSHWNGLGAKACADAILAVLSQEETDLATEEGAAGQTAVAGAVSETMSAALSVTEDFSGWTQTSSINGDLQAMLLPVTATAEADWEAPASEQPVFMVEGEITSYFDPRISASGSGSASLIAWRDSFCNSLLPYLAAGTGSSYFSRAVPYYLEQADAMDADMALVECAQRMLPVRAQEPAAYSAPSVVPSTGVTELSQETIGAENTWSGHIFAQAEGTWISLTGWIDPDRYGEEGSMGAADRILIEVNGDILEACPAVVIKEDGSTTDWGFRVRIPAEIFESETWPEGAVVSVLSEPASWREAQALQETTETESSSQETQETIETESSSQETQEALGTDKTGPADVPQTAAQPADGPKG